MCTVEENKSVTQSFDFLVCLFFCWFCFRKLIFSLLDQHFRDRKNDRADPCDEERKAILRAPPPSFTHSRHGFDRVSSVAVVSSSKISKHQPPPSPCAPLECQGKESEKKVTPKKWNRITKCHFEPSPEADDNTTAALVTWKRDDKEPPVRIVASPHFNLPLPTKGVAKRKTQTNTTKAGKTNSNPIRVSAEAAGESVAPQGKK